MDEDKKQETKKVFQSAELEEKFKSFESQEGSFRAKIIAEKIKSNKFPEHSNVEIVNSEETIAARDFSQERISPIVFGEQPLRYEDIMPPQEILDQMKAAARPEDTGLPVEGNVPPVTNPEA